MNPLPLCSILKLLRLYYCYLILFWIQNVKLIFTSMLTVDIRRLVGVSPHPPSGFAPGCFCMFRLLFGNKLFLHQSTKYPDSMSHTKRHIINLASDSQGFQPSEIGKQVSDRDDAQRCNGEQRSPQPARHTQAYKITD